MQDLPPALIGCLLLGAAPKVASPRRRAHAREHHRPRLRSPSRSRQLNTGPLRRLPPPERHNNGQVSSTHTGQCGSPSHPQSCQSIAAELTDVQYQLFRPLTIPFNNVLPLDSETSLHKPTDNVEWELFLSLLDLIACVERCQR